MGIIRTENLTFEYTRKDENDNVAEIVRAVDGVDLDIRKGDFISILGKNGSGKSTLAKHMNALLYPTGGTIWIGGMDTRDESRLWDIRQTAGMIFQNPDNQIVASVIDEDVGFGPENMGVPSDEIIRRVEECLKAVAMSDYAKKSPNHLSGGQKQRIAIAGVLAMRPQCIIMDEPTAMLDPIGRREVIRTVKELNRTENITVILITHYMEEAVDCDRVFVMEHGKIRISGTPQEVFSRVEALKELDMSVPQVTELAYELKRSGLGIPDGILTIPELTEALCRLS